MHPENKDLKEMAQFIEQGKLKPVVDEVFPFEQALKAYDRQIGGRCVLPFSSSRFLVTDLVLSPAQVQGQGHRLGRLKLSSNSVHSRPSFPCQ